MNLFAGICKKPLGGKRVPHFTRPRIEGMAFGPKLSHGRRSLILVSDNNFAPAQFTQFLLFSVSDDD